MQLWPIMQAPATSPTLQQLHPHMFHLTQTLPMCTPMAPPIQRMVAPLYALCSHTARTTLHRPHVW